SRTRRRPAASRGPATTSTSTAPTWLGEPVILAVRRRLGAALHRRGEGRPADPGALAAARRHDLRQPQPALPRSPRQLLSARAPLRRALPGLRDRARRRVA